MPKCNRSAQNMAAKMNEQLPEWIDPEAWQGWLQMRKQMKKPATDRAIHLALKTLAKLKEQGNDPNEVLDQSTLRGWTGLFPVHNQQRQPQQMDTTPAWLSFRSAIRDARMPSDPAIAALLNQFGGLHRLGEQSSFNLDRMRQDFDRAWRSAKSH